MLCVDRQIYTVPLFNPSAGNYAPDSRSLTSLLPPSWDGEENGPKVKLVGWDKDSLIRQRK